ncbi:MAG: 2-succinyl-5-enolpyruvyl-6-hydroxy-3-cyclohexene-1-carboxylic-acid synthase [Lunatimonas sp.]|uniref:2-succinyl-5-enolpyruvyl-6-hydroxy-3- cyclohexene-1-carboxylic-acid synthase n=1 Tax=Lunatimonas sp. TaxID=2060141 RepID=UPI00263B2816|nr:2-succinyl-5-enolpyruvyl-6-hydroxy-3-cyclohexene-1-carboxylic-acid synthase [Lunatimonas sp.]MCC5939491.1 2-succinyl-5-enolpyruvyl-6-hydroxy-3-cyclohexene-1-carboxylic-acid synthase [Lunatimonas sp.]
MIVPAITDLVSICAQHGIKEAVLSPGSRCAPISLAFIRHPNIHCRTISDERSAAFVALGMAQQSEMPVAMVCTSGSAGYNYAPAIAEAFFQQIPLLVITADRPPEWIDQWDGQTIRQTGIFGNHVKKSLVLPDSFSSEDHLWHLHRLINEAILEATSFPQGPVHINVPLREPFYPAPGESFDFSRSVPVTQPLRGTPTLSQEQLIRLKENIKKYRRILFVPGQQKKDDRLKGMLEHIHKIGTGVVVTELISNLQNGDAITHPDFLLQNTTEKERLVPDLIITFGKSILSKSLKQFLRSTPANHWHIQTQGYVPDPFQRLTKVIHAAPSDFLDWFISQELQVDKSYTAGWVEAESRIRQKLPLAMENATFGEFKAIYHCLKHLPYPSKLHLANSMAVRYASFLGMKEKRIEILANRGTSGIDGSNSTAVGCALTTKETVTLITGDMAFFYDRNAFWHNYDLPNLRVVVLNNHAGGIFRLIEGPNALPELEEFFETRQALTAKSLANEFSFEYNAVYHESELLSVLPNFFEKSLKPKILEVFSDSVSNAKTLKEIKAALR